MQVLRHIVTKGTPPPKVWWVPPMGLHSCLRTALRYLNIPVVSILSKNFLYYLLVAYAAYRLSEQNLMAKFGSRLHCCVHTNIPTAHGVRQNTKGLCLLSLRYTQGMKAN